MIINRSGLTIRTSADQIRVAGRATQGVRVINLREGDSIASVTAVPKTEEAEEIGSVGEEGATAPVVEPQIENSNE
jgi:DNA gyrase subunit A